MLIKNLEAAPNDYVVEKMKRESAREEALKGMNNRQLAAEVKAGRLSLAVAAKYRKGGLPDPSNLREILLQSPFAAFAGASKRVIDRYPILGHLCPLGRVATPGLTPPSEAEGYLLNAGDGTFIAAPEVFADEKGKWSVAECERLLTDFFRRYPAADVVKEIRRAMLYAENLAFSRGFLVLREAAVVVDLTASDDFWRIKGDPKAEAIFSGWAAKLGLESEAEATPQAPADGVSEQAPAAPAVEEDGVDMHPPQIGPRM